MQLGGLSRATFSKLFQLQASPGLVSWFEMLATTTGVPLNCRPVWNFGAGVWGGESLGAAALFHCLSLMHPMPSGVLYTCLDRSFPNQMMFQCQKAALVDGWASLRVLSKGKGRACACAAVARPGGCCAARWAPGSLTVPCLPKPCRGLRDSSWKQNQTSNKGPDFHNHTCKNASAVA